MIDSFKKIFNDVCQSRIIIIVKHISCSVCHMFKVITLIGLMKISTPNFPFVATMNRIFPPFPFLLALTGFAYSAAKKFHADFIATLAIMIQRKFVMNAKNVAFLLPAYYWRLQQSRGVCSRL